MTETITGTRHASYCRSALNLLLEALATGDEAWRSRLLGFAFDCALTAEREAHTRAELEVARRLKLAVRDGRLTGLA